MLKLINMSTSTSQPSEIPISTGVQSNPEALNTRDYNNPSVEEKHVEGVPEPFGVPGTPPPGDPGVPGMFPPFGAPVKQKPKIIPKVPVGVEPIIYIKVDIRIKIYLNKILSSFLIFPFEFID